MARARNWDSLSPAYRGRLERGGITRSAYESGANLAKARGHGATPEHPREAVREKNREKYRAYRNKRQELINQIYRIKERWFSHRPKWNAKRAKDAVDKNTKNHKPRGIKELREILDTIKEWDEQDADEYFQAKDYVPGEIPDDDPLYYH